jgi:hypothetical protein
MMRVNSFGICVDQFDDFGVVVKSKDGGSE